MRLPRGLTAADVAWPAGALVTAVVLAGLAPLAVERPSVLLGLGGVLVLLILVVMPPRVLVWLIAASLAPLSGVPHSAVAVILVCLLLAWAGRSVLGPKSLRPWVYLLLLMFARLALTPVIGGFDSLGTVLRVAVPIAFAIAAGAWLRGTKDFIVLAFFVLLVPTVTALYDLAAGVHDVEGRIAGGFDSAPVLGLTGALAFAALWPVTLQTRSKLAGGATLMALFDVAVSGTRGALLACAVVAVLPALITRGAGGRRFRRGLVALILLAPLVLPFSHTLTTRVQDALRTGTAQYQSGDTSSSIGIRATIARRLNEGFAAGSSTMRVLGQGPGASEEVIRVAFNNQLHLPHNEYLRMKLDHGWIGFLALLVVLAGGILRLVRRARSAADVITGTVAAAVAVLALTDNPLFYAVAMLLPFSAIALTAKMVPADTPEVQTEAERIEQSEPVPVG